MEPHGLRVESLTKTYDSGGTVVRALEGVSFHARPCQIVAVVGPSGSGKSTLLAILGTLLAPTSGRVFLGSEEVTALRGRARTIFRRDRIGFVFQANNLIPYLTARENVQLPTELGPAPSGGGTGQADALLVELGLSDRANAFASELSGGERQRVAIARALVRAPQLLLVDEPTANLDSATGARVVDALATEVRQRGKMAVMVTHDSAMAARADLVVTLHDGRLVSESTP